MIEYRLNKSNKKPGVTKKPCNSLLYNYIRKFIEHPYFLNKAKNKHAIFTHYKTKQMKTIQEIIKNRRTTKPSFFTTEKLNDADIKEMLEAANWAPTHKFTEPWRFIVFTGNAKNEFGKKHAALYKENTTEENFDDKKFEKLSLIAEKASHIIAIIMHRDEAERVREIEEIAAVACAVQNMMLVATAKGFAQIWSTGGLTYHSEMKKYLGFNEKDNVMGFLYLGKSDLKPKSKRFSSAEDKTVWKA